MPCAAHTHTHTDRLADAEREADLMSGEPCSASACSSVSGSGRDLPAMGSVGVGNMRERGKERSS